MVNFSASMMVVLNHTGLGVFGSAVIVVVAWLPPRSVNDFSPEDPMLSL